MNLQPLRSKRERDIWRMADGSWGAEVVRNGVGVGIRNVSLARAIWHVLTVRRPDEYAVLHARPDDRDAVREHLDENQEGR